METTEILAEILQVLREIRDMLDLTGSTNNYN